MNQAQKERLEQLIRKQHPDGLAEDESRELNALLELMDARDGFGVLGQDEYAEPVRKDEWGILGRDEYGGR